ncbi:MAG: hypothetical protein ABI288_06110 [Ginsengibacter sp.]
MWIWWVISLIILIACAIFAYRMIFSSYEFLPADKNKWYGTKFFTGFSTTPLKTPDLLSVNSRLHKMEEHSSFYDFQFSQLFHRVKELEEMQSRSFGQSAIHGKRNEENPITIEWKELYYEENALKGKLENALDEMSQKLEYAENRLNSIGCNNAKATT